ncbi:hypothetical protein [Okeania sp. KiyG1]|uniref:hypothetical protein n=1 Tax=Okeania sp. KiyG1 TaxID=2720165 RepID=UPI001923F51C|nr:hypothetical protein [Okeania sp. KiyG1]
MAIVNHFVKRITRESVVGKYLLPLLVADVAIVNHFVKRITRESVVGKYLLPLFSCGCGNSQIIL